MLFWGTGPVSAAQKQRAVDGLCCFRQAGPAAAAAQHAVGHAVPRRDPGGAGVWAGEGVAAHSPGRDASVPPC